MILLIIIVVLPINIMSIVMSNYGIQVAEQQIFSQTANVLDLYVNQMDFNLDRLDTRLLQIALQNADYSLLMNKDPGSIEDQYAYSRAMTNLRIEYNDLFSEYNLINGTFAYFPNQDFILPSTRMNLEEDVAVAGQIRQLIDKQQTTAHWQVFNFDGEYYLVSIFRQSTSYYGAWLKLDTVLASWGLENQSKNIFVFADSDNKIASNAANFKQPIDLSQKNLKIDNIDYLVIKSASGLGSYQLVEMTPRSVLFANMPALIWLLQIVSLVFLLAIPLILFLMNRYVLKPVNKLAVAMKRIEAGDTDYRIKEYRTQSEFDQINRSFNKMMDQIKTLRFDVYEGQIERQKIRMRYLSQQIKPHFILNTLNILYSYEPEEFNLIQKMILLLARYFRYIVKVDVDFVDLEQELNHIRDYYELQLTRYPGKYSYSVTCEPGLEHKPIPPLIIQNFSENIIKYALDMNDTIEIAVTARGIDDQMMEICISDSGSGLPPEVLEQIEAFRLTKEYQPAMGTGILNAIERLELLYGGKAMITFGSNADGQGTLVRITMPQEPDKRPKND